MKHSNNPIVQEVIDAYELITDQTESFLTMPDAAIRGLLISGDAGFGKTHHVKLGLVNANVSNIDYIKGSSITAAALFVKLFQNRQEGDILILDDVDIINKPAQERNTILDLLKGATEPTIDERILSWERATPNQLMRDNEVPSSFNFNGSIIWITNDTIQGIATKCKSHWGALSSRFDQVPVWLDEKEKLMYTLYLLEEVDMLGANCYAKEDGYSRDTIEKTVNYIKSNYKYMYDFNGDSTVSPRAAIKIADSIYKYPDKWEKYCNVQFIKLS